MQFSTHQEIGDRKTQQDRWSVRKISAGGEEVLLAVVCDGHSGADAAEYAAATLPNLVEKRLRREDLRESHEAVLCGAIRQIVRDLDHEHSGTTLSAVLIDERREQVALAVLGDSPIVLFSDDRADPFVTPQHNTLLCDTDVTTIRERINRIRKSRSWDMYEGAPSISGHYIMVGARGVNLTRAAGDARYRGLLLRDPFIATRPFHRSGLVLLGTDGVRIDQAVAPTPSDAVWTRYAAAANLVRGGGGAVDVAYLASETCRDGGYPLDNITVVTIFG